MYLELGLPCIGEALYYLVQRIAARILHLELGLPCIGEALYYLAQRRAAGRKEEEEKEEKEADLR